jgi:probable addiction module antidote protein
MVKDYTLKSFDTLLLEELRDPEAAAIYLQDAWEDSIEEFLVALRKYVQANGGMTQCAERAHLSREALYRMLSENGNPEVRSLRAILNAGGLTLTIARPSERIAS